MTSLKNLTATFSTAVGPRRYILPSLAIAIGTLLDVGMLKFGILLDADGPFAYLPFAAGDIDCRHHDYLVAARLCHENQGRDGGDREYRAGA